jgi:hypothetical protein
MNIGGIYYLCDEQFATGSGTCDITASGTGELRAAGIIKNEGGGAPNFAVSGNGKATVEGDRTAGPTSNGILKSGPGATLSADYASGETTVMGSAQYSGGTVVIDGNSILK